MWDLWRNEWFRKEKEAGRKWWPGNKECWRLCKEEFASLDQAAMDSLRERSQALSVSVGMMLGFFLRGLWIAEFKVKVITRLEVITRLT